MDCLTYLLPFVALIGDAVQPKVLGPEAAREALIRFVKANPKARETAPPVRPATFSPTASASCCRWTGVIPRAANLSAGTLMAK